MILKGNQRGGGQQLAAHLMNSFDNERVEITDVRGAIAHDLSGAFAEFWVQSRATRCEKYLYSLSINPDQAQGRLTQDQYHDLIARTERSLKLVGQPRAVVFHEKRDKDGILREHCHVVWSRILTDENKAVHIDHDRLKLRTVARGFARDHGLELPDGLKNDGTRDRFNKRARQENLAERQQKERTGVDKDERMAEITSCWKTTTNGPQFIGALEAKGYTLARGERHGKPAYCVVDLYGEIHSLSRQLDGVTAKQMKERLKSSHPFDKLPAVDDAQAAAKQKLEQIRARVEDAHKQQKSHEPEHPSRGAAADAIEQRRSALQARQQQRRAELDKQRLDLFGRQFAERGTLRDMQAAEISGVAAARYEKQPKGLAAFLTRITGIGKVVSWAQDKADRRREAEHKNQTEALQHRHGRELKEMDRHYTALDRLEKRENRAADNAVLRETYRSLRVRAFALKPEFDKALTRQEATGASGDARKFSALFSRLAEGVGFTKGDLQAAFERAHSGKTVPKGDADSAGRAPDQEKLDRARQLREDLERRQPKDRDKDHER
jgi:hypothetical protein